MAFRADTDLMFLGVCTDAELDRLVQILIKDPSDGSLRVTEELTQRDAFKRHNPRHSLYWKEIAGELQCFGANSVFTFFRGGKGILYREILGDVCDHVKIRVGSGESTQEAETKLVAHFAKATIDAMSEAELAAFIAEHGSAFGLEGGAATKAAILQIIVNNTGFFVYKWAAIVVNGLVGLLGGSLSLAANATIMSIISVFASGPAMIATGLVIVGSPAFRVTVPACLMVACLRRAKSGG